MSRVVTTLPGNLVEASRGLYTRWQVNNLLRSWGLPDVEEPKRGNPITVEFDDNPPLPFAILERTDKKSPDGKVLYACTFLRRVAPKADDKLTFTFRYLPNTPDLDSSAIDQTVSEVLGEVERTLRRKLATGWRLMPR